MAFPTTGLLDQFNRANEGPPPSASWVNSKAVGLKVASNECAGDIAAGSASSWNTSFGANQECYAKVTVTTPTNMTLYARLATATDYNSNHYEIVFASTTTLQFWKRVSGVWTQMGANETISHSSGDQWGIEVNGTTITTYKNGVSQASRTDSDVAGAGFIGLAAPLSDPAVTFDDFGGGAIVVAGGQPPRTMQQHRLRREF
jgi:hypothetical protein